MQWSALPSRGDWLALAALTTGSIDSEAAAPADAAKNSRRLSVHRIFDVLIFLTVSTQIPGCSPAPTPCLRLARATLRLAAWWARRPFRIPFGARCEFHSIASANDSTSSRHREQANSEPDPVRRPSCEC